MPSRYAPYDVLDSTLELMVLQVLASLGSQHGYAITVRLQEWSGGALQVNRDIFPVMQHLEQGGLVSARWDADGDDRRARFYAITASGRRQLTREKAEWDRTAFMLGILRNQEDQKRELEIAREVQSRFFPQNLIIAGLDCAGACRPALEVGGDYYDFIPVSTTTVGMAIADVSGKGIAASLLMATVRAYLRGQIGHKAADLCALMSNLNTFVGESSEGNRYATFFYAQYDSITHELAYINSGHNPPFVFKGAYPGSDPLRLETGGPVIGLLADCSYAEGRVRLDSGDLLVAYTDGVTEARSPDSLEWGEDQLVAAVQAHRTEAVDQVVRHIISEASSHVASATQHDDMTLVVVRCI